MHLTRYFDVYLITQTPCIFYRLCEIFLSPHSTFFLPFISLSGSLCNNDHHSLEARPKVINVKCLPSCVPKLATTFPRLAHLLSLPFILSSSFLYYLRRTAGRSIPRAIKNQKAILPTNNTIHFPELTYPDLVCVSVCVGVLTIYPPPRFDEDLAWLSSRWWLVRVSDLLK